MENVAKYIVACSMSDVMGRLYTKYELFDDRSKAQKRAEELLSSSSYIYLAKVEAVLSPTPRWSLV